MCTGGLQPLHNLVPPPHRAQYGPNELTEEAENPLLKVCGAVASQARRPGAGKRTLHTRRRARVRSS